MALYRGDSHRSWETWYDQFVRERAVSLVFGAARSLARKGIHVARGLVAVVAQEVAKALQEAGGEPPKLGRDGTDLFAASLEGIARVREDFSGDGADESAARFETPAALQGYIAVVIRNIYIDYKRLERDGRFVRSEDEPSAEDEGFERAERRADAEARLARSQLAVLRRWWDTRDIEAVTEWLSERGVTMPVYAVFAEVFCLYRVMPDAVIRLAVDRVGDPVDPCADPQAARAYLRAWLLAGDLLPRTTRRGGWSREDVAELIAPRAAFPLDEEPETFGSIAERLGRTQQSTERKFERLRADHPWIARLTEKPAASARDVSGPPPHRRSSP